MNNEEIRVGIADLNTAVSPKKLITVGLGSCIGIAIYDPNNKIGGLLILCFLIALSSIILLIL